MSTPAEIIAARVNGLHLEEPENLVSDTYSESSSLPETAETAPLIADESAFPALGGSGASVTSTPSWGPHVTAPKGGVAPARVQAPANGKFKVSTIQEAFSLDADDQLNVARPDFIKILTGIKADTRTNIEATTSQHTKKRTFLITGRPEEVKLAKRLVIKKLTKPVKLVFAVPAKIRSRIIGAQGRNLKPIVAANEVRIDIGSPDEEEGSPAPEDDDDVFSQTVKITIEGDVDGCKQAKAQILAIVKEETKSLALKVALDAAIKPFAAAALAPVELAHSDVDFSVPTHGSSGTKIALAGDREAVLAARDTVRETLAVLAARLVTEEVPIPKVKHQFLPIEAILEAHNVLITLPGDGETAVKFTGERRNISAAQEDARKTTLQYKVEVLDMSKAHRGNLGHVRAVAALLTKNGTFKRIAGENDVVINAPSMAFLSTETTQSIPIEIVTKNDDAEATKNAKKALVSVVNRITPDNALVVDDIDTFVVLQVPHALREAAQEHKVSYVVLGGKVTLFSEDDSAADDFDFAYAPPAAEALSAANKALDGLRELGQSLKTEVLDVSAADQANVVGPRNTTLKSILASVEKDAVKVSLDADAGKITVRGLPGAVGTVSSEIRQVLQDIHEYQNYSTTVTVTAGVLSRLIGRNGAGLAALREEFGVKIDISDDGRSDDASTKVQVVVAGVKRNADEAAKKIGLIAKKLADETLVRVKIEHQYHRRMIGQNGMYINRLQDKYGVKIRFPAADSTVSTFADAPKSKDEVTIKGPSKGVQKAEEELKELQQFEKENGFKQTVQIPLKAMARVIGKSGETINDIADGAGVEYRFNRNNDEEKLGFAEVELTGSKAALKEAAAKIQAIVAEVENFVLVTISVDPKYHRDLIGQGGQVMRKIISNAGGDDIPRAKYYRLLSIPNEGLGLNEVSLQGDKAIVDKVVEQVKAIIALKEASITEDYELAKEKHRLIVGPSGLIRQALEAEFGATINIPRPSDASTIVQLVGLPEKVAAVRAKLDEMTKDDWNEAVDVPLQFHALVLEKGAVFKTLKNDFNVDVVHGNFTRQASKLSSTPIPAPPADAAPEEGETSKLTVLLVDSNDLETVIPWRLKGLEENTKKAVAVINSRLENARNADSVAWLYALNPALFHKVVGPQGSVVNKIRTKTNTFITIPRANEKYCNYIYLVGLAEGVEAAAQQITALLK